jgi:hypothetical protein
MPGVVDRWECDQPVLNIRFVDFAAYYDLAMDIAPRADPEYKGKTERCFWSTEQSFLNGRTFHTLAQFQEGLAYWLEHTVMRWPHPETKRPLAEMMQEERPHLRPLPARPYDVRDVFVRMVDTQGYVFHETNRYRVPDAAIGSRVYLCVDEDRIEIFDWKVHRLADHERLPEGAGRRSDAAGRTPRSRYDLDLLEQRLGDWGQVAADFAAALRREQRYPGVHMMRTLNLQLIWSADDVVKAFEHALIYHAVDASAVERILRARFRPRTLEEQVARKTREHVRTLMQSHPVEQRALTDYTALTVGDDSDGESAAPPNKENRDEKGQDE